MGSKTAALVTLGCRLNQADSALLSDRLKRMGFEIVPQDFTSSPNLIVVNSCTVTATAFKKSKQALRSIRAENPQSFIVLTGCAADVDKKALNTCEDYDLLLSNEAKKDIERILPRYLAYLPVQNASPTRMSDDIEKTFKEEALSFFPFKTRANLKVQEGCNNRCTYCIVPLARGSERSRDLEETLTDFRNFVDQGFKEIVLSGVNTCNYQCGNYDLIGLLEKLLEVPGDHRIRLSSTEPGPILPRLVQTIRASNGRICEFLHLPLQNGSDTILKAMGRTYLTGAYADFAAMAREAMPHIHIGSDLIVGFPGETAEFFEESFQFLKKIKFANLHVFPFSPREGTPAATMSGRITGTELEERLERLKELKFSMQTAFYDSLVGASETVLVETKRAPFIWEGWSGNYVKTRIKSKSNIAKKQVRIKFIRRGEDGIMEAELEK